MVDRGDIIPVELDFYLRSTAPGSLLLRCCLSSSHLWQPERTVRNLNFLVPKGYTFLSLKNSAVGACLTSVGFLSKVIVNLDEGASLFDMKSIMGQGWDLVANPGSYLYRTSSTDGVMWKTK